MKMKLLAGIAVGLIVAAMITPCLTKGQSQSSSAPTQSAASSPKPATQDKSYVIGPEDVLDIDVWKQPNLSRTVPVRPDGKISLPLLGDVQAAGVTPTGLGNSIQEMLQKYVSNPQVTVIVTAINSQRIYVLGEVNRPGAEQLFPNMTPLQALSAAGGFTQFAKRDQVYILRSDGGKEERFRFNYKAAVRGDPGRQTIVLHPGDTIVVP
jgi:polysaccharide export outer membrane protein